jgi:hypothetical protein
MWNIKGFLVLTLERHRYTTMQNSLDNTEVTWIACRHVPANHQTA